MLRRSELPQELWAVVEEVRTSSTQRLLKRRLVGCLGSRLERAPEEIVSEIEAARAALRACGVGGSSLWLAVDETGQVILPAFAAADPNKGAESSTARRVLRAAVDSQRQRQQVGAAACAAVKYAGGASDQAFRQRARLCERLHAREAALLNVVAQELSPT